MNVNLYITTDYENKHDWTLGENEPNSKPIYEMPKMNVNKVLTKDYGNVHSHRRPRTNPIPPTRYAIRNTRYEIQTRLSLELGCEIRLLSILQRKGKSNSALSSLGGIRKFLYWSGCCLSKSLALNRDFFSSLLCSSSNSSSDNLPSV